MADQGCPDLLACFFTPTPMGWPAQADVRPHVHAQAVLMAGLPGSCRQSGLPGLSAQLRTLDARRPAQGAQIGGVFRPGGAQQSAAASGSTGTPSLRSFSWPTRTERMRTAVPASQICMPARRRRAQAVIRPLMHAHAALMVRLAESCRRSGLPRLRAQLHTLDARRPAEAAGGWFPF